MAKKKKPSKSTTIPSPKAEDVRPKIRAEAVSYSSFWKNHWWKALILMVVAIVPYIQGMDYGYVLDDAIVITDNQFTTKGADGIWEILTNESMTGYFGEQQDLVQGSRYRPLSLVTFAAEIEAFGMKPRVSHIGNMIIYGLTCMSMFWMLFLLLQDQFRNVGSLLGVAFLATLIYAVHPVHTEAVANIKGRDEIMALMFSLLTIIAAVNYVRKHSMGALVGVVVAYFLGLMSKENAITFLAIIPASLYFFTKANKRDYLVLMGSLIVTTIVYLIIRFSAAGVPDFGGEITDIMNNPFVEMNGLQKYSSISYTLLKYLGLSFAPVNLSHDYYPYAIPILNFSDYRSILGIVAHLALAGIMVWKWKAKSITSYSILFYLAALSIVSNVVINVGTFMNERFIFISTVGVCLWIAYILVEVLPKWKSPIGKYVGYALLGLMTIGYAAKTYMRVPAWESALTLNESAVKVSTGSARANSFMATALYNEARSTSDREIKKQLLTDGDAYADKAISILPNYKNGNLMKAGIAGEIHRMNRDLPKLISDFKTVASNRPDIPYIIEYIEYLAGNGITDEETVDFYYDVGYNQLLLRKRNTKWAMHYLTKAYQITKENSNVNKAIGDTYKAMGDMTKAQNFYRAAGME